jgi:adenylate kinase
MKMIALLEQDPTAVLTRTQDEDEQRHNWNINIIQHKVKGKKYLL